MKNLFWTAALLVLFGCNEPTIVGSDLLEGDGLVLAYSDEVELNARTVVHDSIRIYDPSLTFSSRRYLCGRLEDPVFGLTEASIYTALRFKTTIPSFDNAVLDSVVLVMVYDTLSPIFGDSLNNTSLDVFQMAEEIDPSATYYSNQQFSVGFQKISEDNSFNATLNSRRNFIEVDPSSGLIDTVSYPPHARVRLIDLFGDVILNADDSLFQSEIAFQSLVSGIQVKVGNTNQAMLAFDFLAELSGLSLFYHVDTSARRFDFSLDNFGAVVNQYVHDYAGSQVQDFIDNAQLGDSLVFMQGLSGVNAVVEFPDLIPFQDVVVNRAVLEFTIGSNDQELSTYFPLSMIAPHLEREDGGLARFIPTGGGELVDEDDNGLLIRKYKVNVAGYFQDALLGMSDNKLIFMGFPKVERAERSVIFGPGHSKYPLKLKLTYTIKP